MVLLALCCSKGCGIIMKTILLNIIIFTFISCGPMDVIDYEDPTISCTEALMVASFIRENPQKFPNAENTSIIMVLGACDPKNKNEK